jgi:hypothetical protein
LHCLRTINFLRDTHRVDRDDLSTDYYCGNTAGTQATLTQENEKGREERKKFHVGICGNACTASSIAALAS